MTESRVAAHRPAAGKPERRVGALRLVSSLGKHLEELAAAGYPHEVCGLLVGREAGGDTLVERLEPARNMVMDRLRDRYLLDPDDFLAADGAARRDGLEIVGIWHTHPDQPAHPSAADLQSAWEGYAYVILAVARDGVVERRCWRVQGSRFVEQPIEVTRA